jgi:hypothetical protein
MIRLIVLGVVGVVLAGCVNPEMAFEPPTVDLRGVDLNKYYPDLADCTQQKRDAGWLRDARGITISKCLTERGYKVLSQYGT